MNRLLPKSLFACSETLFDKSKVCSRQCQNSPHILSGSVRNVKRRMVVFPLVGLPYNPKKDMKGLHPCRSDAVVLPHPGEAVRHLTEQVG
jgi:hypothetical protein